MKQLPDAEQLVQPSRNAGAIATIHIDDRKVVLALGLCVFGLALAHVCVRVLTGHFGITRERLYGLDRFFDLGREANLPSFFSALLLLAVAVLLALIARNASQSQGRTHWQWWGLAAAALFLSVDEAAMIHEGIVGSALEGSVGRGEGVLHYNWYKLYVPAALLLAVLYVPFLLRLPRPLLLRLVVAACVFLSGAVGLEMLEAYITSHGHSGTGVVQLFEETAEMTGVLLALRALLLYIKDQGWTLQLRMGDTSDQ
jgi:hypothetical protein